MDCVLSRKYTKDTLLVFAERLKREIRRLIPKGTDLSSISNERIKAVETWVNNYPREIFDYATSGLYRPEKSDNYYECTVIKAIRDTQTRFQPKKSAPSANKPASGNDSDKGGK